MKKGIYTTSDGFYQEVYSKANIEFNLVHPRTPEPNS